MCNFLHRDSTSIPSAGVGYKIFSTRDGSASAMGMEYHTQLGETLDGRVLHKWDDSLPWAKGNGFCFMLDRDHAFDVAREWSIGECWRKVYLYEIEYFHGLGQHQENNMFAHFSVQMALCREFIIGSLVRVYRGGENVPPDNFQAVESTQQTIGAPIRLARRY